MTVTASTSRADYNGNGVTTAFTVPFYFLANSHLQVIKTAATGLATTLALGSDYTVTGAGVVPGGTVTCTTAPASGEKLSVLRNVPLDQQTHYVDNDPFPAASHEQALDKLTMITQQLSEAQSRSLTLPKNSTSASNELPSPEANKFVAWNSTATQLQNVDPATLLTVGAYGTAKVDIFSGNGSQTAFTLSENPGLLSNIAVTIGGVGQTPGIDFTWTSGTTLTFTASPPAGTNNIVARYMRVLPQGTVDAQMVSYTPSGAGAVVRTMQDKARESISIKDKGGLGAGTTDETTAGQAALTDSASRAVLYNAGTYKVSSLSLGAAQVLTGEGKALTTIKRTGNTNAVNSTTAQNTEVSNLSVNMDKTTNGYDGHGIVFTQANSKASNVSVTDFGATSGGGGTGAIFYGNVGRKLNRLLDSEFTGNTGTMAGGVSYGWIFEDTDVSFAHGLYASTIHDYAHELKNTATYNALSSLVAESSGTALGYGQDTLTGPGYNLAYGVVSKACDVGWVTGYANYNLTSGLLHNNTGAPAVSGTSHLARFDTTSSYNALFGAMGIGSFVDTVRYNGNSNYAQIVSHDTTATVVSLSAGAAKNVTEVAHPGARTSVRGAISDSSGNAMRGSNANPVVCNATGERVGSISGKFWDKLGASGASANTNHHWVKESEQYAVESFLTPGNNGDSVGIAYAIPGVTTQGYFLYQRTAADSADYWGLRVGNTDSFRFYNTVLRPATDNNISAGNGSFRFSTVFAGTATINTSDAREKQQIRELSDKERAVALRLKFLIRAFKFNDAVEAKGDGARIHVGVIAQDVKAAFEAEGLVAEDYAILCYDEWDEQQEVVETWEEERDEAGNVVIEAGSRVVEHYRPAGNRYGVRYEELLAFILGAM